MREREATTSIKIFGRLFNARIASVLIRLVWLLPSVVNERGTSLVFCSCLRLLHFAVYFMEDPVDMGHCQQGAVNVAKQSPT